MTLETFITALLPSLCVSVIMTIFTAQQKKREERAKERESVRKDGEKVQLSLLLATAKLAFAVAMAVKNGKPNGEVEDGIDQYREAMKDFKKFERELVAEKSAE